MTIPLKSLAVLATVLGVTAVTSVARADYVCSVTHDPRKSSLDRWSGQITYYGTYGTLYANFYTGPGCTGTYKGGFTICSSGATYSLCNNTANLYSSTQFYNLLDLLRSAASEQQYVYWSVNTDGPYLSFYGY
jgi:hypothetical protein